MERGREQEREREGDRQTDRQTDREPNVSHVSILKRQSCSVSESPPEVDQNTSHCSQRALLFLCRAHVNSIFNK